MVHLARVHHEEHFVVLPLAGHFVVVHHKLSPGNVTGDLSSEGALAWAPPQWAPIRAAIACSYFAKLALPLVLFLPFSLVGTYLLVYYQPLVHDLISHYSVCTIQ